MGIRRLTDGADDQVKGTGVSLDGFGEVATGSKVFTRPELHCILLLVVPSRDGSDTSAHGGRELDGKVAQSTHSDHADVFGGGTRSEPLERAEDRDASTEHGSGASRVETGRHGNGKLGRSSPILGETSLGLVTGTVATGEWRVERDGLIGTKVLLACRTQSSRKRYDATVCESREEAGPEGDAGCSSGYSPARQLVQSRQQSDWAPIPTTEPTSRPFSTLEPTRATVPTISCPQIWGALSLTGPHSPDKAEASDPQIPQYRILTVVTRSRA